MGLAIDRDRFDDDEYGVFGERLAECLRALEELLERPAFGTGETSIGAELELALVDDAMRPLPLNRDVLRRTVDPRVTVELDRFNLECNLRHGPLAGRPFAALRQEMEGALGEVRRAAAAIGGRAIPVGILPTLTPNDLQSSSMTDLPRYRALSNALRRSRSEPFRLNIHGEEALEMACDDVTFEGAATSLQLHLRVDPASFAAVFNGLQLATAPALAVAGNSPTFLGKLLWDETRVALFKQAVDDRGVASRGAGREARVSFGNRWVVDGAFELFDEAVTRHAPLIPIVSDEDPLRRVRAGEIPRLDEIRLHQGTVWSWNRPVYDPAEGGHLRIEMRALPAGPTPTDMLANTAFLIGLGLGLAPEIGAWCAACPFERAHHNFYRAAQLGLEARLDWPRSPDGPLEEVRAGDLVPHLLDIASAGLRSAGVDATEVGSLLDVVGERSERGCTGAAWQRASLKRLERQLPRAEALIAMFRGYVEHSEGGEPVHRWAMPS